MTDISIRLITEKDFPALVELITEFAAFERQSDKMVNTLERMQAEKAHIHGFVACQEDQIVGYVICFFAYFTWIGKSMYMDDLYVKQIHRSRGIGSQLIQKVIGHARDNNCHKVRWQVSDWNAPAIEFYKKLGAQIEGTESNCDLVF